MKKRILAVVMALALVFGLSGMALAGNLAKVDQKGTVNTVHIEQIRIGGSPNNQIDIDQVAGTINLVDVFQEGSGNDVDVIQEAGTFNDAEVYQEGNDNRARIDQDARTYNLLYYVGQSGDDNNLILNQVAGTFNEVDVLQRGNKNEVDVSQTAATSNWLHVDQLGNDNLLVGASALGAINLLGEATQISVNSHNELSVLQSGNFNEVGLHQEARFFNDVCIKQLGGGNSLVAWQKALHGSNELTIKQRGDMRAVVIQDATSGNNVASITQE